MARKTKLNEDVTRRIVEALRVGNTRKASALAAGVDEKTFYNWLRQGEADGKGEFFQFFQSVLRAEAACEVQHVAIILKAAHGYDTRTTRTKTQTREEMVVDGSGKPVPGPDGRPMQTVITETETITTDGHDFDWRASVEWLKRRQRAEWGDSIDIKRIPDETLIELLERDAQARGGTATADSPAVDNRATGDSGDGGVGLEATAGTADRSV